MNKNLVESTLRLNKAAARAYECFSHQQVAIADACLQTVAKQWQVLAKVDGQTGLLAHQVDLIAELSEQLVSLVQNMLTMRIQIRDELRSCLEDNILTVPEKLPMEAVLPPKRKTALKFIEPRS